jgi:hypothetical protein
MGKNDNRRSLKMRQRIRQTKLKTRLARKQADAKAAGLKAKEAPVAAAPPPPPAKAAEKKKSKKKAAAEAAE